MRGSSDGKTRSLIRDTEGAGWDFNMSRHPYHEIERPYGPYYTVYNRRYMCVKMDKVDTADGYWKLRREAAVLNTGEFPVQFKGPDAEKLLDLLFTKDITKVRPMRCGYGLACYDNGTMITDGVLVRLAPDLFWYVQADGDFYNWAMAHTRGMDVKISDPQVYVSQCQGPNALKILEAASDSGALPEKFGYFGVARVMLGGQEVVITRTGYTNELGWEYYTESHHDAQALWAHLEAAGKPFGMSLFGLDSMHIRRIEAGIQNAGSDFGANTTPFEAGLGHFVQLEKENFIGKAALEAAPKDSRSLGVQCPGGEPMVRTDVLVDGKPAGKVTAGAFSPYLKTGTGIVLMDAAAMATPGAKLQVQILDGSYHEATLVSLPMYDAECLIPRGKLVDIPEMN